MAASTKDLVNRFIKLDTAIKKKEGEVEKLKEERGLLEAELMPRFEQAGIASMKSTIGYSSRTTAVRRTSSPCRIRAGPTLSARALLGRCQSMGH